MKKYCDHKLKSLWLNDLFTAVNFSKSIGQFVEKH